MVNPISFDAKETVLEDLTGWLRGPQFEEQPVLARREELFSRKTQSYENRHWLVLELIAAYSRQPGDVVGRDFLNRDFEQILSEQADVPSNFTVQFGDTISDLVAHGMIEIHHQQGNPMQFYSLKPSWWDLVHDELRSRERMK